MAKVILEGWQCEFEDCKYKWYAKNEPKQCARCKRRNWNNRNKLVATIEKTEPIDVEVMPPEPKRAKKEADLCEHGYKPSECIYFGCRPAKI